MYRVLLLLLPRVVNAHESVDRTQATSVTGSYQLRRGSDAGCWMQAASIGRDSVRVQIACSRGAPSYNSGFLEARLPTRASAATYSTTEYGGLCTIRIRFRATAAVVQQEGTDAACGFGFGVYADGTYTRRSRRTPPFDLRPDR